MLQEYSKYLVQEYKSNLIGTLFNVFTYISIGFLNPISLGPYNYSLAEFSIYTDDDSRSSRNVYVTGYVVLFTLMDLSSS